MSHKRTVVLALPALIAVSLWSFVRCGWRGELPPWLVVPLALVLLVPLFPAINLIGDLLPDEVSGRMLAWYFTLAFAAAALAWLWTLVALWRSLSRATPSGRGLGLALVLLAAPAVVATMPATVKAGCFARSEWRDLHAAPGQGRGRSHTLDFDYEPTTRTLWMKGPYGRGAASALHQALSQHPRASTLALVSPGGLVVEADAMIQMIGERDLDTYAPGDCASACVLLFAAGQQRWIGSDTWIGLHRSGHECIADNGPGRADQDMAQHFLSRGVSQWLVDMMLETPHDDILVPSHAQLLASSMATGSR